jgi:hypothetical protein
MELIKIKATDVKIGDVLNVNTGYRPLDDENCEVLKIENRLGLFGDKQISFFLKSYEGNHWFDVSLESNLTLVKI